MKRAKHTRKRVDKKRDNRVYIELMADEVTPKKAKGKGTSLGFYIDPEIHRLAKSRAKDLKMPFTRYIRQLILNDLAKGGGLYVTPDSESKAFSQQDSK